MIERGVKTFVPRPLEIRSRSDDLSPRKKRMTKMIKKKMMMRKMIKKMMIPSART
jgi:hypothetical protein